MAENILQKCPPPTAMDKYTLKAYAEQCGKQVALEWVQQETGVQVASCAKEKLSDIPDCVADNYSINLDLVNADGSINWDNVVHDAGAVGGMAVCAATGAGVAALPICAKVGSIVADVAVALGKTAYEIGSEVLGYFFGGEDTYGISCNYRYAPVLPVRAAQYAALFFKSPVTLGWFPQNEVVGEQVLGTKGILDVFDGSSVDHARYWSRLLLLRGLASASAALADDMARQTSSTFAEAVRVLNPLAPKYWTELARPTVTAVPQQGLVQQVDFMMNVGGLLSIVLQPNAIWTYLRDKSKGQLIVPHWQIANTWAGVPRPSPTEWSWYCLMFIEACDYQATIWSAVKDEQLAIKRLRKLPAAKLSNAKVDGPPGRTAEQAYWLYSVPKQIDLIIRTATDKQFTRLIEMWRESLQQDLSKKMQQLRTPPKKSSTVSSVLTVGASAGLVWGALKYLKVIR